MAPTIRIDDEVYSWLQGQARPFDDTPNSVLRRLARLDGEPSASATKENTRAEPTPRGVKTPQGAYREPILKILANHGGQAARTVVLNGLEKVLAKQLTPFDKGTIESGTIRWQKSAEFEVYAMRKSGLLKAVSETPPGYWTLTKLGERKASDE